MRIDLGNSVNDPIKCNNICLIRVPEGEERENGAENVFEDIITEKFSNLRKKTYSDSPLMGQMDSTWINTCQSIA